MLASVFESNMNIIATAGILFAFFATVLLLWKCKDKLPRDLGRDFAVDGMRMMAARNKITIAASFYGKLKTTVQMTALIIILLNQIVNLEFFTIVGNIALYLALVLTAFSGLDYLIKGKKLLTKPSKQKR